MTEQANTATPLAIIRRKKLAEILDVSTVTLWRMRHELPPQIQISKGIRGWLQSDISAWLERRGA